MNDRGEIVRRIEAHGVISIVRTEEAGDALEVCRALYAGGARVIEVSLTTPGALGVIERAGEELAGCLVGVGTVLDAETASEAIRAGAAFVFSPVMDRTVIEVAHRMGRAAIPGAYSPTEILEAWAAGADLVKVFPATKLGAGYLRDVLAPLPQVKLTPTGGIDVSNVGEWLRAGAAALGVGSAMMKKEMIRAKDWAGVSEATERFVAAVEAARRMG